MPSCAWSPISGGNQWPGYTIQHLSPLVHLEHVVFSTRLSRHRAGLVHPLTHHHARPCLKPGPSDLDKSPQASTAHPHLLFFLVVVRVPEVLTWGSTAGPGLAQCRGMGKPCCPTSKHTAS